MFLGPTLLPQSNSRRKEKAMRSTIENQTAGFPTEPVYQNNGPRLEISTLGVLQKIPLSKIRPNPNNPRHVIDPDVVESLAINLREEGQKTPVKARPLTPEERQADPDHEFELVGGHYRYLAAPKAGLTHLDSLVLDITPGQAFLEAGLDNRGQKMTWWDDYIAIETLKKIDPDITQQKIGTGLR